MTADDQKPKAEADNACFRCGAYLFDWDKEQPHCSDCTQAAIDESCEHTREQTAKKIFEELEKLDLCCVRTEGDDPEACNHAMKQIAELKRKFMEGKE